MGNLNVRVGEKNIIYLISMATTADMCLFRATYLWILTLSTLLSASLSEQRSSPKAALTTYSEVSRELRMPGVKPTENDQYFCLTEKIDVANAYIVQYEALAQAEKAHHILLFGCQDVEPYYIKQKLWNCGEGLNCHGMKIMFAWGKNAESTKLPKDVGFEIGSETSKKHLILQVHYAVPLTEPDYSGLKLYITNRPQRYLAGIFIMMAMATLIPPNTEKTHSDINCIYSDKSPMYTFAYRVHAHKLGTVITGYDYNSTTNEWTLLGKGNPQWPQAFYPMDRVHKVNTDDILSARCTFNSTLRDQWTYIGKNSGNEMCNFYIMFYHDADHIPTQDSCVDTMYPKLVDLLPGGSDTALPPNPALEDHALHTYTTTNGMGSHTHQDISPLMMDKKGLSFHGSTDYADYDAEPVSNGRRRPPVGVGDTTHLPFGQIAIAPEVETQSSDHSSEMSNPGHVPLPPAMAPEGKGFSFLKPTLPVLYSDVQRWAQSKLNVGQVTAVTVDADGNLVIFHRGGVVWGALSFDVHNRLNNIAAGPIPVNTIITLDSKTGRQISAWGKNLFYMPHGLFIDHNGNVWLTDVALHQVLKFPAGGAASPLLSLGIAFEPGSDNQHFCKPASVAVASSGEFFVADGYCNSRIIKYSAKGEFLLQWGRRTSSMLGFRVIAPPPYAFDVPHSLALAEDRGLIYVADRENGRIQSFFLANGTMHSQVKSSEFNGKLFAVAYSPARGGILFAVNGPGHYFWQTDVKGFVIDPSTGSIVGYFTPSQSKYMENPHDVAVSADGTELYVAELGPNKVWKFHQNAEATARTSSVPASANNTSHGVGEIVSLPRGLVSDAHVSHQDAGSLSAAKSDVSVSPIGTSNLTTSMVIMALLAIPVLVAIIVAVVLRLKRQGKFHRCNFGHVKGWMTGYKSPNQDRFSVANILNRHKGFDRVNLEESDADGDGSESDVEEYSAGVQKA